MEVRIKRVYEKAVKNDGTRILADRLWPRGVRKSEAHADLWIKELAPSGELRSWFHKDPEKRFAEFKKKYRAELKENKTVIQALLPNRKSVTLVTAVKDIEHSHIPTLKKFLESA